MQIRHRTCGLVALLIVSSTSIAAQDAPMTKPHVIDDSRYTQAQQRIQIEPGRSLNLFCTGSGSPTVIFDAGLGDETSTWGLVQPEISRLTRTCSYDRAGIGFSDPATRPSTSANIVDDLHKLLAKADVRGPYVLVGHSYGGLNMLLFASRYPSDVVGMVSVDPANELQATAMRQAFRNYDKDVLAPFIAQHEACIKQAETGFDKESELYRKCIGKTDPAMSSAINAVHDIQHARPAYQKAVTSELKSVRGGASEDQVRAAHRTFGDMPIIVLTRTMGNDANIPLGPNETKESRDTLRRNWIDMHEELASRSTRGQNRNIANTGHYIQLDQPGAVITAIKDVLRQASSDIDLDGHLSAPVRIPRRSIR